ncbi:MFS transporter [Streptosporangium sp. NPDC004379]|uniref:MFS transporter n=1 Tax=Streptosporangium sp. NPDC004379 TaxID=3366189 RepID=UPI0036D0DDF2
MTGTPALIRSFDRPVRLLLVNQLTINTGFYMLMPYLAGHLSGTLALPAALVGLILGVRNLSQQGLFLVGGTLADRLGCKPVIVAGCGVRAVAFLMLGVAGSIPALVAASALTGFAGALFNPAVRAYLAREAGERRVEAFAAFNAFGQLGILVGPLVGLLLNGVTFTLVCLTAGTMFAVLTVAQMRALPPGAGAGSGGPAGPGTAGVPGAATGEGRAGDEEKAGDERIAEDERKARDERVAGRRAARLRRRVRSRERVRPRRRVRRPEPSLWREAAANRSLLRFSLAMAGSYALNFQIYLGLPLEVRRVTAGELGVTLVFVVSGVMTVAGQARVTAWAGRRWGPSRAIARGLVLMGLAFVPLAVAAPLTATADAADPPSAAVRFLLLLPVLGTAVLLSLATMIIYPFEMTTVVALGPEHAVGTRYGLYSTLAGLGVAAGNLLSGWALDLGRAVGLPSLPWLGLTAVGAGCAAAVHALNRAGRLPEHPAATPDGASSEEASSGQDPRDPLSPDAASPDTASSDATSPDPSSPGTTSPAAAPAAAVRPPSGPLARARSSGAHLRDAAAGRGRAGRWPGGRRRHAR